MKLLLGVGAVSVGGLYLFKKIRRTPIQKERIESYLKKLENWDNEMSLNREEFIKWLNDQPITSFSDEQMKRLDFLKRAHSEDFYWNDIQGRPASFEIYGFVDDRRLKRTDNSIYKSYLTARRLFCIQEEQRINTELKKLTMLDDTFSSQGAIIDAAVTLNNYAPDCFSKALYDELDRMKNKFPDYFYLPNEKSELPSSKLHKNKETNEKYKEEISRGEQLSRKTNISEVWPSSLLRKKIQ